jgi:hypothetical protein
MDAAEFLEAFLSLVDQNTALRIFVTVCHQQFPHLTAKREVK